MTRVTYKAGDMSMYVVRSSVCRHWIVVGVPFICIRLVEMLEQGPEQ